MPTIQIEHRLNNQDPTEAILLQLLTEQITARELIKRSVTAFIQRLTMSGKKADPIATAYGLFLTQEQITAMKASGKVAIESARPCTELPNQDKAIKQALTAFRTGVYTLLINGRQVTDLDEVLSFEEQTKAIFIRLVPLVGG